MEKSASEISNNASKLPRRQPRNGPSEKLLNIKRAMKLREEQLKSTDFIKDDYEVAQNAKNLVRGPTGIVFDDEMTMHYCLYDTTYPENPERYNCIIRRCKELGLIDRCKQIPSRLATADEILNLHSPEMLELLKSTSDLNNEQLEELASTFDSVYFNNSTYTCAAMSAGCAIELVNEICQNNVQNGMAIIRPPGHHAMSNEFCGYCFVNNAALAANHAMKNFGLNRILIVDWDVHHGQGTQQIFYEEPRIVYFSIHRYENGTFWPELRESDFDYTGGGSGKGFNFNVPLNATGAKDADYLAIFQQVLLPMAYQYEPELIIVSAGYDAAVGCPETQPELIIVSAGYDSALGDEKGEMEVSPACYAHLITSLMGLAKGKVAVLLEGGYCPKSLGESAALTLRGLLGDAVPSLHDFGIPLDSVVDSILNVIYVHRPHWQCFQIQESYSVESDETHTKKKNEKTYFDEKRRYRPAIRYSGKGSTQKPMVYETRDCYPVLAPAVVRKYEEKLDFLKSNTELFTPDSRVALAYFESMTQHESLTDRDHPEKPERIKQIFQKHEEYGLLDRCLLLKPRSATKEELLLLHDESYVTEIANTAELCKEDLIKKGSTYDSVYFHPKTYDCALESAGSVLQVVDEVVLRRSRSGVAIVRPPGHHAEKDAACGFCMFNNVALAAKYAIERHNLKRVLLLDWDVHHGNGCQRMFESDDRVLYISLHRYNNGKFFPSSTDGDFDKVGVGRGEGFNINIPWNKPGGGMTDGDYIAAFHSIILPVAYQFDPELVLVSAGFDACIHDPLGNCKVTPEAYAHMTHWLTTLANGRVILTLEGGYNVVSISYALTLCTKALLGDPLPPLTSTLVPSQSALDTIRNVLATQEKYWRCLRFNASLPKENVLASEATLKDVDDILAEKLKKVEIDSGARYMDANHKPGDTNENGRRNNQRRLPLRGSDSENASSTGSRPTLVQYLSENMQRLLNEEMFAVVPLPGCPHLVEVQAVPQSGINVETPCANCYTTQENWICLICYSVHCGRYVNQHMVMHNEETNHPLTLSFTDLSVWCYVCEAYIDNMVLYPAKNAVHRSKFGSDLQWSYGTERQPPAPGGQ